MKAERPKIDALRKDFAAIIASWGEALRHPKTEFTRDSAILRFELAGTPPNPSAARLKRAKAVAGVTICH